VARVRRAARERRIGHTGTLDPSASGVLPLVVGRATRLARFLSATDKTYDATIELGVETTTYDSEGRPVGTQHSGPLPSREEIDRALDAYRGTFLQQPPIYSAKKIGGVRSYELARQLLSTGAGGGAPAQMERKLTATPVTVASLELLTTNGPVVRVSLRCSAGFYVRSLAHDLGQRLGTGAHLKHLRRTASGELTLADAVPLDAIEAPGADIARLLVPMGRMLASLAAVVLTADGVRRARHGRDLGAGDLADAARPAPPGAQPGVVRLLSEQGEFIGIAEPTDTPPGLLHPSVVLV